MDTFTVCVIIFIGICSGCFYAGRFDANHDIYMGCLGKDEIVVKDVRFSCKPEAILIQGKEVPYQ